MATSVNLDRDTFIQALRDDEAVKGLSPRGRERALELVREVDAIYQATGLEPEELVQVEKVLREGQRRADAARAIMILANLRLVVSIAKRSWLVAASISSGRNIGLMKAVEKFVTAVTNFDLCDLVDPPVHHPSNCRPGTHNPDTRASVRYESYSRTRVALEQSGTSTESRRNRADP